MVTKGSSGGQSVIHKMFASLESGLSYQYHAAWGLVLQVLGACFQVGAYSTVRLEQNSRLIAGDIFKCILLKENLCILIQICPKFMSVKLTIPSSL